MAPLADNFLLSCDDDVIASPSSVVATLTSSDETTRKSLTTTTRTSQRKTVTFAPYNTVMEIVHINDLEQMVDINTIWFSRNEFENIKANVRQTVHDIDNGIIPLNNNNDDDDQCYCTRGLENMTERGSEESKERIFLGRQCVLDEQNLQRYEGINDPELIADVFFETTYQSQCKAQQIAIQDRKDILESS